MDLFCESKLEDSVCFIVYYNLNLAELQISLLYAMHETTRCRNDNIGVQHQSFELVLHVISTSNANESKISVSSNRLEISGSLYRNLSRR